MQLWGPSYDWLGVEAKGSLSAPAGSLTARYLSELTGTYDNGEKAPSPPTADRGALCDK